MAIESVLPDQIEKRSFEMITRELGDIALDPAQEPIIKRVIHTTADFDYVHNLAFSKDAVPLAQKAIREGQSIVTDTNMAAAGINKRRLSAFGGQVLCYMDAADVAAEAKERGVTRATVCMERGALAAPNGIFAIGNAPTALIKLNQMIQAGEVSPSLIIAVPVGFVNVVEAKQLILECGCPSIVAKGRKGGSNVAAAICNALIYGL